MIMAIYKKAFAVLMKKPIKLWGISLLYAFLVYAGSMLCGMSVPLLGIAVTLLLQTSMTLLFLYGYRGEEYGALNLFDCFRDWKTIKRVLCGMGWMLLWIVLWSLIPFAGIVFGLIRTYEYRLTPYILMMEPDVKPTDAIKLSKERTKGWKGKMFGADILVYVAFWVAFIILILLSLIPYAGYLFMFITAVFVIVFCLLICLFMGLVKAAFYEEIQKWGTPPSRDVYATPKQPKQPKGPAPQQYAPPQGYDPYAQQPQQYAPPQGYDPYAQQPQGYPPQQYAPPQGYDPYAQQPQGYPPQQYAPPQGYDPYAQPQYAPPQPQAPEAWQPPQAPEAWQQPQAPEAWQQPQGYVPPQPDIPQPNFPQSAPPVYPQPDFPPQPAAPEVPPEATQE